MRKISKRAAIAMTATAAMAVAGTAGIAYAAWTVKGSTSATVKAGSSTDLVLTDVSSTVSTDLYPGGVSGLKVTIKNDNTFPVTVTSLTQTAGAKITSGDSTCDAASSVSYIAPASLTVVIEAGATADVAVPASVAMSEASVDACQGKAFSVPLTATGHSGRSVSN